MIIRIVGKTALLAVENTAGQRRAIAHDHPELHHHPADVPAPAPRPHERRAAG
jgi:hypothetical protein